MLCCFFVVITGFLFKQKTAYVMRISDWSSDVCSSDLRGGHFADLVPATPGRDLGSLVAGGEPAHGGGHRRDRPGDAAADQDRRPGADQQRDRTSVVSGKSVSVRVEHGGRRIIKKYTTEYNFETTSQSPTIPKTK